MNSKLFQMEPDTGILHLFTSNGNIRATSVNGRMWLFASDLARHFGAKDTYNLVRILLEDPNLARETTQKYKEFCQAYFNTNFANPIYGMIFREAFWQNTVKYQQARRIQEMQDQINGLQAKTDFVDALTNTNNTISLADLAKLIWNTDIGHNRLMEMMRNDGYLMKKGIFNTPTQASLNHDLMIEVITATSIPITRITPTGIGYFINIYRNNLDGVSQA